MLNLLLTFLVCEGFREFALLVPELANYRYYRKVYVLKRNFVFG